LALDGTICRYYDVHQRHVNDIVHERCFPGQLKLQLDLKWRSEVEVAPQIALVEAQVAHHHHVAGVPEDSAKAFDLTTFAEVASGEGVAQAVGADRKADSMTHSAQEVRGAQSVCRPAITTYEELLDLSLGTLAAHVTDQLAPQPAGDRNAAKLGTLAALDL